MQNSQGNASPSINVSSGIAESKSGEFWQLGADRVRRIGFGAKRLAGSGLPDGADVRERAIALLRRVVELGVNHLDTAAFYPSHGRAGETEFESLDWANDVIRQALAPYPDNLVIATKVGPTKNGLARPDELRGLVEADLRALSVDTLDLVYLRQLRLESIAEHFGALAELQAKGMIRQLGISNVRVSHLHEAREIAPVVAVQNRYSVGFGRVNDEILQLCGELGIAFVPFFAVTAESREAGGVPESDPVQEIAARHGATAAQVRLAWTLSRGPHVLAIPGTSSERHLEENLRAGDLVLSPDELTALDSVID
ncbi:aryl-alcohol dehydrogenase-like predicted oxidoreductase [Kribbella aluminosa]|uniref:Aryl-alcohol dehydrogenase-like predicted oxidoreductase n=1 Tax=Kribbella aluminosa TaxID=416017 RepID=A0ABS4UML6_9ACTN|nr:aldo/keto reductase [Kribbella aluminosa]MBP2352898.1 aryl-alcohol dehydrogenase-like predicted oxidoreductase [Kribbella aluminosa]